MIKIGLTGGIGSGKSRVRQLFAQLGAATIDADDIARMLVEPGQAGHQGISETFGEQAFDDRKQLRRSWLRQKIFNHEDSRKKLEAILHPLIFSEIQQRIAKLEKPYVIVEIPLLFESEQKDTFDRTLLVYAEKATRVARIVARDNCDATEVERVMSRQIDPQSALKLADDVIYNDNQPDMLLTQVSDLDKFYRSL